MRILTTLLACAALTGVAIAHRLPLGDGKVTSTPRQGYVMTCDTRFPGGDGATRSGDWIAHGTWDPDAKPYVEGKVRWPNARITISVENGRRIIRANSLPTHATGEFPVREDSVAFTYDRNPNRIAIHDVILGLPARPALARVPGCIPMGIIGFAVSGVAIFNAFDLQGRDAPAYEIQDRCNGHPERDNRYHYHDWSPCLRAPTPDEPVGWMLDGFPILGPDDSKGRPFANKHLDACHGRTGRILVDGRWVVMYHYRFTREYPYTIGCYRGTVAAH